LEEPLEMLMEKLSFTLIKLRDPGIEQGVKQREEEIDKKNTIKKRGSRLKV
jgi:hypothetical protein